MFLLLLFAVQAKGQYFIIGQEPASVKWQQIKTRDYRIIYPNTYGEMAQYYIKLLRLTQPAVNASSQSKLKRTSVILHNNTVTSNAVVPVINQFSKLVNAPGIISKFKKENYSSFH